MITSHPLPYPRFFYQSLQQTRLKLAVSPQVELLGNLSTSCFSPRIVNTLHLSRELKESQWR